MTNERRCPMCGRPNPADAEVCQHCGARLTFMGEGSAAGPVDDAFRTDWFEQPEAESQERPPTTDDTAWLRGFFAAEESTAEEEEALAGVATWDEPENAASPGEDTLAQRLDAWAPESHVTEGADEPAAAEEAEAPGTDWLPPWAGEESSAEGAEEPTTAEEAGAPGTGWLPPWAGEESPAEGAEEPTTAEEAGAPGTDWLPPWAGEESPAEGADEPATAEEAEAPGTGWLPPWAGEESPAEGADEPATAEEAEAPGTDWLPPWAGEESPAEGEEEPTTAEEAEAPGTGWLPPWLNEETASLAEDAVVPAEMEHAAASETPEAEAMPPSLGARQTGELALSVDELEELLASTEDEAPPPPPEELLAEVEEGPAAEAEPELDKVQVPEWLRQAAPPSEAPATPSVVDEILEQAVGEVDEHAPEALLGIPDVLPGVPDVVRPRVRSRPSLTLRLTRRQEQRAQWLQELLQAEKQPRRLGAPWSTLRFGWLRALVGMLLVLAAVLLGYSPWGFRAPAQPNPAWEGVYAAVEALPPDAPVLIAVDASWATAPEVRAAARPVVEHLLRRHAQVLVVSTVPWGVGVLSTPPDATAWQRLGYIPGGAVALAQMRQALPYALQGRASWPPEGLPAWQGVQSLAQVGLVVVLTDSPEQARLWVEQVAPALVGHTGLALVLSSQAEPWIQPYLAVPGVQGAVVGIEGALAYGQRLGLDMNTEQGLWQRTQSVWVLATVLMVVAAGSAVVLQRFARRLATKSA